jgi:glycosyltransferase involved in cell wall biosynthesis
MPVPVTSVVIPAYRAWETLPLVLDALFHQVAGRNDREVIVVESSADGRARAVAGRWPWARLIILDRRASVGEARNIGVRHARGSLLAFLDADAVPSSNWLDELEQALTPEMEMVGGRSSTAAPGAPCPPQLTSLSCSNGPPRGLTRFCTQPAGICSLVEKHSKPREASWRTRTGRTRC